MTTKRTALVIFARFPRLGRVKTRLQPRLRPELCLQVHTAFLLDTLARTAALDLHRFLFLADCSEAEALQFARGHGIAPEVPVRRQTGEDLGDRMWQAYQEVAGRHPWVLFIGTDSPTVPLDFIRQAAQALREVPVVVGPSEDGGYYLIGLSEPRRELFYGLDWGTERVLEQTLSRLNESEFRLAPVWYDIDEEHDLHRLKQELSCPSADSPQLTSQLMSAL